MEARQCKIGKRERGTGMVHLELKINEKGNDLQRTLGSGRERDRWSGAWRANIIIFTGGIVQGRCKT